MTPQNDTMTPMNPTTGRPWLTSQMEQALSMFSEAGQRIEEYYQRLAGEVQRLTGELEASNLELRHNLAEKEKMQAILVSTLQSLTVGVLAVGQDGVIIVANPAACKLFERPLEMLAGLHVDEILADVPEAGRLLLTLQGNGPAELCLQWMISPENQPPRYCELAAVRAVAPYDMHLAGLVLVEDQTELRRLEYQAQLRSRLTGMGAIAMNLAHEIRNPLGSIQLFATALERELLNDESLGPLATQIVNGVKSLEHLVANTLEFSKPRRLSITRVNLVQVLRDSLIYVEHPLRQKFISIRFASQLPTEAWIAGDAEQLRQVFLNLLLNAIQAVDEGGLIEIKIVRGTGGGWEIDIKDNGGGIPHELIDQIFDPFFTTKDKGSGIGLSIVHTILSAHEAHIDVHSRPGEGAAFHMVFPEAELIRGLTAKSCGSEI